MKTVSAHEADKGFSKLLIDVAEGEEVVITVADRPIARLVPYEAKTRERREAAIKRMTEMMDRGFNLGGIQVDREEIYNRGLDETGPR